MTGSLRSLQDLLATAEGRQFLEERALYCDQGAFVASLESPADGGLARALGLDAGQRPVAFGHQICCDYQRSVSCKFHTARHFSDIPGIVPVFVGVDTDRSGANRGSTTVAWGEPPAGFAYRLVSNKFRQMESRFVPVEVARREELVARLADWLAAAPGIFPSLLWRPRLDDMAEVMAAEGVDTLAELNLALTRHLLACQLDYRPPIELVSRVGGLFSAPLGQAVERIEQFVAVYNEAVAGLLAAGVDPQVRPLDDDYLPLHFACPKDGRRERLRHVEVGGDHFAVTQCYCGVEYRFHLGRRQLSADEILATDTWSTDVTFLIYLNDHLSGLIPGRSSALYSLVFAEVMRRVLDRRPVPLFLPPELAGGAGDGPDSLMYDYLVGSA